jgi:ribosome maturation factor RimP
MSLQPGVLRDAIEKHVVSEGYECVDIVLGPEGGRRVLRIMIDHEAGVPLEACAKISRSLGALLEEVEELPGGYVLEVSSPGINRPLVKPEHFQRFQGERAKIKLRERMEGDRTLIGVLGELQDAVLEVQTPEGTHRVPLENIATAHLHRDLDEILKSSKRNAS